MKYIDMSNKTSFKNSKIKISQGNLQSKNYEKLSLQTVLSILDKYVDKKLEAILKTPPLKLKGLKGKVEKRARRKKEREGI
ncbi:MAG: hypothetical protein NY202_02950 [Mollicutes bacterium UO1]